ncbi:hypothetical protein BYT27DRAFT_7342474 [Phlegmacium glaucopus]|nr:hypothetical protein BYT27DRAFT_7342474 [Phlegmacium glaucopus]
MKFTGIVNVFVLLAVTTASVISEHQDTNSFDIVDQTDTIGHGGYMQQNDNVDHNDQDSDSEGDMAFSCSLKNKEPGVHCEIFTCLRGGGSCTMGPSRCSGTNLRGKNAPIACLACKCTRDAE